MNRRDIPHPEISIAALFDDLTMLVFYMKDADGTFVRCNRRFEEFHGLEPGGAMGLTDYDLNEAGIADSYRAEDREVMESGVPSPNRTWMVPGATTPFHPSPPPSTAPPSSSPQKQIPAINPKKEPLPVVWFKHWKTTKGEQPACFIPPWAAPR